jgi:hypothetical protein
VGRHLTNDPLIDSGTGLSSRVSRVSHMATSIATPGDAVKRYRIAGAGAGRPQLERHPPRPAMSANTTTAGDTTRSDVGHRRHSSLTASLARPKLTSRAARTQTKGRPHARPSPL